MNMSPPHVYQAGDTAGLWLSGSYRRSLILNAIIVMTIFCNDNHCVLMLCMHSDENVHSVTLSYFRLTTMGIESVQLIRP